MRQLKSARTREFRATELWDVFDQVAEFLACHPNHVLLAVNYAWEDEPNADGQHVVYLTTEKAL